MLAAAVGALVASIAAAMRVPIALFLLFGGAAATAAVFVAGSGAMFLP